jgi:polysaccharide biosynthesis protein PelD
MIRSRTIFGIKIWAVVETVVLLGLLLAIDRLIGRGDQFFSIQPHPFWIVVLLVAAQYGALEGLMAALLASIALFAPAMPLFGFDDDLFTYALKVGLNPALWLGAALVVGELRSAADRRAADLALQLDQAARREAYLAAAAERLALANRSLEDRVAGQLRTVANLYEAAKAVDQLGPGDVILGIAGLLRAGLNPQKFSVYLLNENMLEAVFNEGWDDADPFRRVYSPSTALYQEVIIGRRRLCAANAADAVALEEQALLAGPIQSAETGQVVGMLKIEKMDALDFNMSSVENFRVVCEWIGSAYARARLFERVTQNAQPQPAAQRWADAS